MLDKTALPWSSTFHAMDCLFTPLTSCISGSGADEVKGEYGLKERPVESYPLTGLFDAVARLTRARYRAAAPAQTASSRLPFRFTLPIFYLFTHSSGFSADAQKSRFTKCTASMCNFQSAMLWQFLAIVAAVQLK